ncbi:succinate dehydrogenase flavoprotein subunit [Dethiosulfatarculus sandiegensis]|uniref:Succinate dehydrogenase flavoprotein subunit n=1 Tax=Dethiosulfatarculus sandiegensis TaxID=1429043 RepID=A0A0D2J6K9_9BACT|nr:succinate dehydrogenase flavoprotein subunit [Dethiosulfatarculus sandiegensis]KIX11321.1 succinate dehydrogenase [Dethiosulfatarculus sandiegensis]
MPIQDTITVHRVGALVVGAGGAGLRAALEAGRQVDTAVISEVFPTRSHTVSAQGGIGASLGNVENDNWQFHMFDTVKGSDWLGDQDAIEFMCREAPSVVIELEHLGLPFSRLEDGRIYQRAFGGHTSNFGQNEVHRSCAAADRTGHAMLHTLFEECLRQGVRFYNEFFMLELVMNQGVICGALAWDMVKGGFHLFHAKSVLFATGGYARVFRTTSNAHICSGDGVSLAMRAGIPGEDLEFLQFHPTGIYGAGNLITEGVRGEGGYLVNCSDTRFMELCAPHEKDLACRDVVSRGMAEELRGGRGCGIGQDYLLLKIDHIGADKIMERLPGIWELAMVFAGVDCTKEPIPVVPTAHYSMGGIPTNYRGEVVVPGPDGQETVVPGFYAAGEAACASVHGANRLGTNSLLDLMVFGREGGKRMAEYALANEAWPELPEEAGQAGVAEVKRLLDGRGSERLGPIMEEMRGDMERHCGVFRLEKDMIQLKEKLAKYRERYAQVSVQDKGQAYNLDLIEALELGHMLDVCEGICRGALAREESRGGHYRDDFPKRDDENWHKHTLAYLEPDGSARLDYKPVRMQPLTAETIPPAERNY